MVVPNEETAKDALLKELLASWVKKIKKKSPHLKDKQVQWMAEVAAEAELQEFY